MIEIRINDRINKNDRISTNERRYKSNEYIYNFQQFQIIVTVF